LAKRNFYLNYELLRQKMADIEKAVSHLAARVAKEAPVSYADCFYILGKNGVISEETARKMASAAKFRNLLVHQYGKIDDCKVFDILRNDTSSLLRYVEEIKSFLRTVE